MKPKWQKHHPMNYEHRKQPLLPGTEFLRRLAYSFLAAIVLLAIWVLVGMLGYHWLAGLPWIDAFLNACMIVGGMGPVDPLRASSAKMFAGFYAILSGVIFLSIFGLLVAPVFHRFLHRFHMEPEDKP